MYTIDQLPAAVAAWDARRLGETPCLSPESEIRRCRLGPWTEIGHGCRLIDCEIGAYSYCHEWVDMISTVMGRFCSIASHVRVNPGNHPMGNACQHHCTYRRRAFGFAEEDDTDFFAWRRSHPCRIGHDVWIGHGALVMPGVTVGDGAVIAAGAVVTRDVEPYTIVGGVPAKLIRRRCPAELAQRLQAIAWWDWDHATLRERISDLSGDLAAFVERYA
jgi:phosphonate metabolism protein (transferase hexapeptide repeat family)